MALITLPDLDFAMLDWRPLRTVQVNRSAYTRTRKAMYAGGDSWACSAAIEPVSTEAEVRQWRAFIALLQNETNTFRLPAIIGPQHDHAESTIASGGAVDSYTLVLATATSLIPGQYATIPLTGGAAQLALITGVASTTITFDRTLRANAVIGGTLVTKNPYAEVALNEPPQPEDRDGTFSWSFEAEEAF